MNCTTSISLEFSLLFKQFDEHLYRTTDPRKLVNGMIPRSGFSLSIFQEQLLASKVKHKMVPSSKLKLLYI